MGDTKDVKDGVTLMADAIRKELAEQEKASQSVTGNVSDATAQFSKKSVKSEPKTEPQPEPKTEPQPQPEPKTEPQADKVTE